MLKEDEPRVKAYIASLSPGMTLPGIDLCDGHALFKDWVFLGRVGGLDPSQFVFVFRENGERRAVAWVGIGGTALAVPQCPASANCDVMPEGAAVISVSG
jgi:hypothetical protein